MTIIYLIINYLLSNHRRYGSVCVSAAFMRLSVRVSMSSCIRVCVCALLTVRALHLPIVSCLDEADVAQMEDSRDNLQHLSLDVTWDPDHLHGFL